MDATLTVTKHQWETKLPSDNSGENFENFFVFVSLTSETTLGFLKNGFHFMSFIVLDN